MSTPGRVFDQDPAARDRVDKDTTVVILVSSGKAKTTVPTSSATRATTPSLR